MFYDNFLILCNKKGIAPSAAVVEMGFQKSVVTRWKTSTPTDANKLKIAEYFGVSVSELMGTETEKAPALNKKDKRDIAREVDSLMDKLESSGDLMFDGDPMSDAAKESLRSAMKLGLEAAKVKNKERFTPKKYRGKE